MTINPRLLFLLLAVFYWAGHREGLRCGCPGPRKDVKR